MLKKLSPILASETRWYRNLYDPVVFGTLCGVVSAVAYTAANICLRSVIHVAPCWVMTFKAIPTLLLAAPWVAGLALQGRRIWSHRSAFAALVAAALFGHFAGNLALQWSFSVIGIALAVPLTLGSMIVAGAVLGRFVLGEIVTGRTVASIGILILAIAVLAQGAGEAHASVASLEHLARPGTLSLILGGVAAACLAGFAYTVLGVSIRYASSAGMPQASSLLIVSAVGLVSLGTFSLGTEGIEPLEKAHAAEWWAMAGAGVFNAIAFVALVRALQLTTLVFVNGVNASQAAMAAVAGVLFFDEASTGWLYVGVILTVVGLMLIRRKRARPEAESEPLP